MSSDKVEKVSKNVFCHFFFQKNKNEIVEREGGGGLMILMKIYQYLVWE